METENGFRITTYKKKDLACLYCPNATARCAIRTLTRWINGIMNCMNLGAYRVQCKDTDIHAEAGEPYRTVSGRTLIFFSTSFIMLKREVAVKLPAFVFVIDTLQHNRYN